MTICLSIYLLSIHPSIALNGALPIFKHSTTPQFLKLHSIRDLHFVLISHYKCPRNSTLSLQGSTKTPPYYKGLLTDSSLRPKDAHQHLFKEMLNLVSWKCGEVATHAIIVPIKGYLLPEMVTPEKQIARPSHLHPGKAGSSETGKSDTCAATLTASWKS